MIPKRAVLIVVPDELVDKAVKTLIRVNQTGKSGDGKIFVMPCVDAISVRTGQSGDAVLDDV
jgi:nitrogen regulatory protein PII 2